MEWPIISIVFQYNDYSPILTLHYMYTYLSRIMCYPILDVSVAFEMSSYNVTEDDGSGQGQTVMPCVEVLNDDIEVSVDVLLEINPGGTAIREFYIPTCALTITTLVIKCVINRFNLMFVCLFGCLLVCLFVCLFTCLFICLFVALS